MTLEASVWEDIVTTGLAAISRDIPKAGTASATQGQRRIGEDRENQEL